MLMEAGCKMKEWEYKDNKYRYLIPISRVKCNSMEIEYANYDGPIDQRFLRGFNENNKEVPIVISMLIVPLILVHC